ncbi:MAG: rRNA (cytosine1402-N4)-methyltransferase [Patescibacteria group bacterium]|nr:rRNA (cytosine1402-N4)-methyltransferase [Patescibacteria group bacterium]
MHKTVLLHESVDALNLTKGGIYVDCTAGAGGHTEEIVKRMNDQVKVIGLDLDEDALKRSEERIKNTNLKSDVLWRLSNFRNFDSVLSEEKIEKVDGFLLDLGFSSYQIEDSGRGFSFLRDEPLEMTLQKTAGPADITAKMIVNEWSEESIANIIYGYGNERFSRRIAREIVSVREKELIETTSQLVGIIENAVPFFYRKGRIHPATKTFQALRIAVNDELGALEEFLEKSFDFLNQDGRIAIISFHSLEDRIVKNFFRKKKDEKEGVLVVKKPIVPKDEELKENPRSRSAKLRIIQKK